MTDAEYETFRAWCREQALEVRTYAAAFGETAEYRYLRNQELIMLRFREAFPGWPACMADSVEFECYNDDNALDLVEINRVRVEAEFPALGFVPLLKHREEYRVPKPDDVPESPPPPGPSFYDWAIAKLIQVRHSAVAEGADLERKFLETQWSFINTIYRNFPDIGPAQGLLFMREWLHTEDVTNAPLDEERLRAIRVVNGTMHEVVEGIERLRRGEQDPEPLKQ